MSAYDAKSVINLGLGKIAASEISNYETPRSPLEKHVQKYPHWRDTELQTRDWYFALTNVQLTISAETNPLDIGDGRVYRYAVPTDMLKPIREKRTEWEQRGSFIYSAQSTLILPYIRRAPEADFVPLFAEVLAWRVAVESVEFSTQSNTKKADVQVGYDAAVKRAAQANAFVVGPKSLETNDDQDTWVSGRTMPGLEGR